jgi:threonine aldolase
VTRLEDVAASCTRFLYGHGRPSPAAVLAELQDEAARGGAADRYGDGGVVAEVEEQVRALLGTEAAVLLPSGVMAQGLALRLHAASTGRRRVAMHHSSHPVLHEEDALPALHDLEVVAVGDPLGLVTADDLVSAEGLAAVLVELPQRETGGQLMALEELALLASRCQERGTALHLDGARLWECGPAYGGVERAAALATTTYVSLYKGLGAPGGAVLAGPADVVGEVRTWRRRAGGSLPALWPLALGARRGLREHLPRMAEWTAHAQALATALSEVATVVAPPVTPLFHLLLPGDAQEVEAALLDVSEESGVFLGGADPDPLRPGFARKEVYAGAATAALGPEEVAELVARAVARVGP